MLFRSDDRRDLLDLQLTWALTSTLSTAFNVDLGRDANAKWGGIAVYIRKNVGDRFSPTLRAESYSDPQGFTTGVAQHVVDFTLTGDTRVGGKTSFAKLLLRPEVRYDRSDAPFFTDHDRFRAQKDQWTAAFAAVVWF